MLRRYRCLLRPIAALTIAALAYGCDPEVPRSRSKDNASPGPIAATANYVGREACAGCHAEQVERWHGSHHDLAMQEATEETVLGDFDDASFSYAGTTTTFYRQDARFMVRTDGPDGVLTDYQVPYVFGVEPLQQLLISLPRGRMQALSIVWDSRSAAEGGQRWYHLYPGEDVDHEDPLHWTGVYQNWNQQCAECHSTNLRKGYDLAVDAYDTTWSEIDVSCEACHGPGSAHAEWARQIEAGDASGDAAAGLTVDLKDRSGGVWEINPTTGIAERTVPRESTAEIDTCGPCHARRSPIEAESTGQTFPQRGTHGTFLDNHRLALLDEGLYHADGHILDEVYVYGSFLQSKMHRAGVTCTDCHDPHRLEIVSPDAACARCHLSEKFADASHHFHPPDSAAASCVSCHMPTRTYMGVDSRHDHSFRIPRPDVSLEIGTPNACNDCHGDKSVEWAAETFAEWYGDIDARRPHFARALDAGRRGLPEARQLLADLAVDSEMPAIARGTALALARSGPQLADLDALRSSLRDPEPLVRLGAVQGAEAADPRLWSELLAPLLDDPIRAVRLEAGRILAHLPDEAVPQDSRPSLELALAEYIAAQELNADRPEGQLNLALMYATRGRAGDAERAYRRALNLDPWFSPAYVNLADLYRATERDGDGVALLSQALERMPEDASLRHTLGLALVRQGQRPDALEELSRAVELAPGQARYAYVYGVALHSGGDSGKALEVLASAHLEHPSDPDLLSSLATISRDAGREEEALAYAHKLLLLRPEDPGAARLVTDLEGS